MKEPNPVRQQQVPMESVYPITITSDYTFIRTDFFYLFYSSIVYYALYVVIGIGYFRILGTQRVHGRKNLRSLKGKGFISVANHCHMFDVVLTGLAMLPRKPWFASVQRNFEAPYLRKLFRNARGFPIPAGVFGLRKILKPVVEAIDRGTIVHLFPEEELWHLYQDIDHFQRGAFYLAHHANCPVVPVVHMFRPRKFFGKELSKNILKIKTVVGEPIYPRVPVTDGKTSDLSSIQEMSDKAQKWMRDQVAEYRHSLPPCLLTDPGITFFEKQ
jgi:1-acyl-sn-glycerol-3-phosphate acyltransferase